PSVGHQLMNLTKRSIESAYVVEDFMTPIEECPIVQKDSLSLENILKSIEEGSVGFTLVVSNNNQFEGLISNADVRKALMKHLSDLNSIQPAEMINLKPITIQGKMTVVEMLKVVKLSPFTVSYLPVVSAEGKALGIVNFANLVKAEL
ncbi:MAG TPA: CBS domain-containing protein, partial [Taishania sp.]|nr:CBS domain-containing protein [Taishania sp.]